MQKDIVEFMFYVAGGYDLRPDFNRAALIMINAFREGQLGKVNLDMDLLEKEKERQESPT